MPLVETENWPSSGYNDNQNQIEVRTYEHSICIDFHSGTPVTSAIFTDRVTFGIDDQQNLCWIQVNGLSKEENEELKDTLTFITKQET